MKNFYQFIILTTIGCTLFFSPASTSYITRYHTSSSLLGQNDGKILASGLCFKVARRKLCRHVPLKWIQPRFARSSKYLRDSVSRVCSFAVAPTEISVNDSAFLSSVRASLMQARATRSLLARFSGVSLIFHEFERTALHLFSHFYVGELYREFPWHSRVTYPNADPAG